MDPWNSEDQRARTGRLKCDLPNAADLIFTSTTGRPIDSDKLVTLDCLLPLATAHAAGGCESSRSAAVSAIAVGIKAQGAAENWVWSTQAGGCELDHDAPSISINMLRSHIPFHEPSQSNIVKSTPQQARKSLIASAFLFSVRMRNIVLHAFLRNGCEARVLGLNYVGRYMQHLPIAAEPIALDAMRHRRKKVLAGSAYSLQCTSDVVAETANFHFDACFL